MSFAQYIVLLLSKMLHSTNSETSDSISGTSTELQMRQTEIYFFLSSSTIVILDFLENIVADYSLCQHHSIRLPTVVYFASRLFTLALFMQIGVILFKPANGIEHNYVSLFSRLSVYWHLKPLYFWGSSSPSTRTKLAGFLGLALGGAVVFAVVNFNVAGVASGIFDLLIFLAVLWKLGWRVSISRASVMGGMKWTFWVPFKRDRVHRISDRLLEECLIYLLIVIIIKIPQIISVAEERRNPVTIFSLYLDIAISNIMSSKIFRDMKLGLPGLSETPFVSNETSTPSRLEFTLPVSQAIASSQA
ncbi:hypothetical protein CPB83DRAFT_657285 [Crepidotus variabilis]|uniref:Uncharacterized protein n=1 Tax=Crepidotus variabilis TaxID=179855 RepID=A0A9P6E773_9AGAR|nr:hypothetical protein CPB83DRAFT_657285 [Crepidotus variabilis]